MLRQSLTALLAVSLIACGGENATEPPPPPLPPITRLVLEDTSALMFTGSAVPGKAFVAHAYDATGAEVKDPVLTLAAGSGWTVKGDTLIAPATEGRTTLRISATRAPSADWVHLEILGSGAMSADVVAPSTVTDSMHVTAGIDLRAYRWTATWWCDLDPIANVGLDSIRYQQVAVDSVVYPGDAAWVPNYGGVAQLWWHGDAIRHYHDGTVDTASIALGHNEIAAQAPDTLLLSAGYNNPDDPYATETQPPLDRWPAVLTDSAVGRTYAGGNWCQRPEGHSPVTLAGAPI